MFSPDNFYDVFSNRFSHPKTDNIVVGFPHGCKDWPRLHTLQTTVDPLYQMSSMHLGRIILHDQEPIHMQSLANMRDHYMIPWLNLFPSSGDDVQAVKQALASEPITDYLHLRLASGMVPILCHSEIRSAEVQQFESNNFLSCYYWYHGMIAQDWFRHWRWHDDLEIKNKSDTDQRFLLYARGTDGTRVYRRDVIEFMSQYKNITVFNWNDQPVESTRSADISVADANAAHVHIVAETLFDTDKIHLTEKILKPIVMSQAFVLFGPPGSLAYLRSLGFQTFDHLWDESYDLEPDHHKRKQMLCDLLTALAQLPQDQFAELCERTCPIIQHNRRVFYSMQFQLDLYQELQTNMHIALEQQQASVGQFPAGTMISVLDKICDRIPALPKSWHRKAKATFDLLKDLHPDRFNQACGLYKKLLERL